MLKERDIPHININNVTELAEIYDFKEMLGKGHFGTVIEISVKASKRIWALKIVDKPETIPVIFIYIQLPFPKPFMANSIWRHFMTMT